MTLRLRVTLAAGMAVLLAVAAVSVAVYVVVRGNLHQQIDQSLIEESAPMAHTGPEDWNEPHGAAAAPPAIPDHLPLMREVFMQVVDRDGDVVTTFDNRPLPVTAEVLAVARGDSPEAFFNTEVSGRPVRVYVQPTGSGAAVQVGRSLTEVEQALRQLLWTLAAISLVAVGLAVLVGRLVAAAAVAPVHRVAAAADAVARTGELSHHIDVPGGGDDLSRLATNFNLMLDALGESLAGQRRLVADASHELRTPLATVRTNVEVLARAEDLAPGEQAVIIRDTVAQIGELTRLVGDLVELARGDGEEEPFGVLELHRLTRKAAEAVGRNYPGIELRVSGSPSAIRGAPARVSRAVSNLLDNAAKWSPAGSSVEVTTRDGAVVVRDHGPGLDPSDLPHLFDRFYRSPGARGMPGSGLGLAIVKQVADSHGGSVTAGTWPGGGAEFVLRFPVLAEDCAERDLEFHDRLSSTS